MLKQLTQYDNKHNKQKYVCKLIFKSAFTMKIIYAKILEYTIC